MASSEEPLPMTTTQLILEKIQSRAEDTWGQKWMAELTKEYCAIAQEEGEDTANPNSRRTQLERIFERGTCNSDSLFRLVEAVGYRLQLVSEIVEEI
jgi:hypothetical protein